MSLYFDTRVQNPEIASISTFATWHINLPLLAVAAYSQDKGGFAIIFDDQGETLPDVEISRHSVAQITAIAWHPEKKILAIAWESGEIRVWPGDTGSNEFNIIVTPHRDPITILVWSQYGGLLVSGDIAGSLVGWKSDMRGQLIMLYHHELKESFTDTAFKIAPPKPLIDINGLAKAAVAGDESALDLFSSWRPRTAAPTAVTTQKDYHMFYIGTASGNIYYVNSQSQCNKVLNTDGLSVQYLLYHQTRDSLVIMYDGLNIGHFQVDPVTGQLTEITKVKLSGKMDSSRLSSCLCWAGNNTLAILTGELMIRCWDLYTGDTYILTPIDNNLAGGTAAPQEICTCLNYCKINDTLSAGTNLGTIYLWKRKNKRLSDESSWPSCPDTCSVTGAVKQLSWGASILRSPLLVVNCITNVFILHQQPISAAYNDGVYASQISPTQLLIQYEEKTFILKTDIQIQIIAINKMYVTVSSGKNVAVYKLSSEGQPSTTVLTSFTSDTEKLLIYDMTIIILTPQVIELRSIEDGTVTQTLPMLPEEGEPITMELTGNFLTVASLNGVLKIWDLGKREAKLHTRAMATYEAINDFAEIIEARCNSDCSFVSITVAMANLMPSPVFYVWDIESDQIHELDFSQNDNEIDTSLLAMCKGRLVTTHCWDNDDPRLLICRAQRPESFNSKTNKNQGKNDTTNVVLVTLFVTSEYGIVIQNVLQIKDEYSRLLGVQSPIIIILDSEKINESGNKTVRLLMKDFEEVGSCDQETKRAILDFCFYLSIANMDEAFKAIKTIQNEAVWKNLGKMCVKTKQLDMAMLCLGHMKQARSTRVLREAMKDESLNLDTKVGVLAIELELYDDAEQLFRQAGRLDYLGSLYEARNKFQEAIELAKTENKIREKTSYYNYAKALELDGKISESIEMFTKADCHRFEVPRMLLNNPKELTNYLSRSTDPEMITWYAQYTESKNDMEGALQLYQQAKDTLSVTRLLCFFNREDEACAIVSKTKHAASAYHLANHYESRSNIPQAIHFYTMAKAYTNAIRVCKENNMSEELWPLATMAPQQAQIDVAKYYEDIDQPDKAILLYHKAGLLSKAIDLAFKSLQFDALQLVAVDISADSDPVLIEKCAEYFLQNGQVDKAVNLLANGKNYLQALRLIEEYDVTLDDELAVKLDLENEEIDLEKENLRLKTLERIAEVALNQGNYHLAAKKFTQAGNKITAMKALLKSGDTEKICFFAQVSRQKEIYIMAGNYLQSLDWQNQPEVLKNIINFYTKGKAMDLLANFYVACAQVEIDEFQNYEKALDALSQANRCLSNVSDPRDIQIHNRAIEVVNNRISIIRRYLEVKKFIDRGEIDTALTQVKYMLDTYGENLEQSIRRGDLFAMITEYYISINQKERARATIEELQRMVPGINLSYYFNANVLEALGYKLNIEKREPSEVDDDIEELLGE